MNNKQNDGSTLGEFLRKNRLESGQASPNLEDKIMERTIRTNYRWRLRVMWSTISTSQRFFVAAATLVFISMFLYLNFDSTRNNSLPQIPTATIAAIGQPDVLSDGEVMDFFSETISGVTQSDALLDIYPSQHLETL
jgi:hypothetical protein